jgi:hypothetical protein
MSSIADGARRIRAGLRLMPSLRHPLLVPNLRLQLLANSEKRFAHVSLEARSVLKRRVEDRFHHVPLPTKLRPPEGPPQLLVPMTHEILALADEIRRRTPAAAKRVGFEFGRMKTEKNKRAGSIAHRETVLAFINKTMQHAVPKGWTIPMLAALRANVQWNLSEGTFKWRLPVDQLLNGVIDDLVRVCVSEHRDNNNPPELVGSRESSYRQCYDKVLLYLAQRGLIKA